MKVQIGSKEVKQVVEWLAQVTTLCYVYFVPLLALMVLTSIHKELVVLLDLSIWLMIISLMLNLGKVLLNEKKVWFMVSKIQLNEQQLKKSGLCVYDDEQIVPDKYFSHCRVRKRCLKCGKYFITFRKTGFVLCKKCGEVKRCFGFFFSWYCCFGFLTRVGVDR